MTQSGAHERAPQPEVTPQALAPAPAGVTPGLLGALTPSRVLALQRTAGNQAVGRVLARDKQWFTSKPSDAAPQAAPGLQPISASKKADPILTSLNEAVAKHNGAAAEQREAALAEVYFAADMWLKTAGAGSENRVHANEKELDASKHKEVNDLFIVAATTLAETAGVSINRLPVYLEEHYGKGMTEHGVELDVQQGLAKSFEADERDRHRVHIAGGKLLQHPWWDQKKKVNTKKTGGLVTADSSHDGAAQGPTIHVGYTGFTMGIGGDLYVARHAIDNMAHHAQANTYHSTYFGGGTVLVAGEMKIVDGVIEEINLDSGHYAPSRGHLTQMVKFLKMQGVDIDRIKVRDHNELNALPAALKTGTELLSENLAPDPAAFRANDVDRSGQRQRTFNNALFGDANRQLSDLRSAWTNVRKPGPDTRRRFTRGVDAILADLHGQLAEIQARNHGGAAITRLQALIANATDLKQAIQPPLAPPAAGEHEPLQQDEGQ